MRSRSRVFVIGFVLAATSFVAQETSPAHPAPSQPRVLRVCTNDNPPPCATGPVTTYAPDPEYSDDARKHKTKGVVNLEVTVGVDGRVHDIHVLNHLGHGLDEQAVKAVKQWTFNPGESEGAAVPVQIKIEVSFRTF